MSISYLSTSWCIDRKYMGIDGNVISIEFLYLPHNFLVICLSKYLDILFADDIAEIYLGDTENHICNGGTLQCLGNQCKIF